MSGGKSGVRGEIRWELGNPVSVGKSGVSWEIRCQFIILGKSGGISGVGGKSG